MPSTSWRRPLGSGSGALRARLRHRRRRRGRRALRSRGSPCRGRRSDTVVCSSVCRIRGSPRASTGPTWTSRPTSSPCSKRCSSVNDESSSCWSTAPPSSLEPWGRLGPGDRRGLARRPSRGRRDRRRADRRGRPAAVGSPRRCRSRSTTSRRRSTSPATRASSATARASSSATAPTTSSVKPSASRSVTDSRTPRSRSSDLDVALLGRRRWRSTVVGNGQRHGPQHRRPGRITCRAGLRRRRRERGRPSAAGAEGLRQGPPRTGGQRARAHRARPTGLLVLVGSRAPMGRRTGNLHHRRRIELARPAAHDHHRGRRPLDPSSARRHVDPAGVGQ